MAVLAEQIPEYLGCRKMALPQAIEQFESWDVNPRWNLILVDKIYTGLTHLRGMGLFRGKIVYEGLISQGGTEPMVLPVKHQSFGQGVRSSIW